MKPELISTSNSFTGGMDKDSAPELLATTKYLDAQNGRAVSIDGSTFRFENLRGDTLYCSFPDIPIHKRWKVCVPDGVESFDLQVTITFDGKTYQFPVPFNVNPGNIDGLEGVFQTAQLTNVAPPFDQIYLKDYISFYRVCNCLYFSTKQIVDNNGDPLGFTVLISNVVPPMLAFSAVEVSIQPQTPRLIIGKVWVAGDLILLTQSVRTSTGLDEGVRQFWKINIRSDGLPFNQTDTNGVLMLTADVLKYQDVLNIPLSSVPQMKYVIENDCIKAVYETDGITPPIKVAVGEPGLNTTPPALLYWNPEYVSSDVLFVSYGNGNLLGGVYQYSYRLLTADGKVTYWSPLTRHITVVDNNFDPYYDYTGDKVNLPTTQAINLEVDDLDTRFAKIQVAYAFSITRFGTPIEAHVFVEMPITGNVMTFQHTVNGLPSGITSDTSVTELGVQNPSFRTVKTLEVYRNRLFAANFCEADFFYDTTGITMTHKIKKIASDFRTVPTSGLFPYFDPAILHDINQPSRWSSPFNDIPYVGFNAEAPPVTGRPNPTLVSDWSDYKGGAVEHALKGYWGDETYRFAIIFLLKNGKTSSAFWIGDYRFPNRGQSATYPGSQPNPNGTVPITDKDTSGLFPITPGDTVAQEYYLNALGLRVSNINLDQTITSGIFAGQQVYQVVSGFQIVRCLRDKQIIAQGVVRNNYRQQNATIGTNIWHPHWNDTAVSPLVVEYGFDDPVYWFYSPDTDILSSYVRIRAGMEMVIQGYLGRPPVTFASYEFIFNHAFYDKSYAYRSNDNDKQFTVKKSILLDTNTNEDNFVGTEDFGLHVEKERVINDCYNTSGNDIKRIYGRATLFQFDGFFVPIPEVRAVFSNFYYVNMVAPKNPSLLYGGSTDDAKAANVYIGTGHFQSVECDEGANHIYEADVWGGDCMVQFYTRNVEYLVDGEDYGFDTTPSFPLGPFPVFHPGCVQAGRVISFPVESEVNGTLRFATSPDYIYQQARNFAIGNTTSGFQGRESFEYSDVYSHDEGTQFFAAYDPTQACQVCLPYSISASQRKISGEKIDSFLIFPVNDRLELSPTYGSITHIQAHPKFDTGLYFWQIMGFGYTPVEEQVLLQDNTQIVVGSGNVFGSVPRPMYNSKEIGCEHQASITNSDKAFYWWCAVRKGLYRFAQDGLFHLSKDYGLNRLFQNALQLKQINNQDTPFLGVGVTLAYDTLYDEVLATFLAPTLDPQLFPNGYSDQLRPNQYFTVAFNEKNNTFSHFFTVNPMLWLSISGNRLLSQRVPLGTLPHPDDYKVFWHYQTPEHGLFWLTPPNYPPVSVVNPLNPDDPADPFNLYWDVHRTYLEYIATGQNKETKVLSAFLFDMNNFWTTFRVRSNPLLQRGNIQVEFAAIPYILETSGHFFTAGQTTSKGCKIQGNFLRVTNVLTTDNFNRFVPLPPALSYLRNYLMGKVRGEQLYVQLAYKGTGYREWLEAITHAHLDRRNI